MRQIDYLIKEQLQVLYNRIKEDSVKFEFGNIKEKDSSFKSLFEVKSEFIELVKTFINEPWVEEINEGNIELSDKEFIMQNAHNVTADVVYRIRLNEKNMYFFLLEFQSIVDKRMPYRLLEYMFEIWRRENDKSKLPVIVPCVLYTGKARWRVKDFKSLFDCKEELKKYIPNFEYVLIDVNRYSDEELLKISNLISSVFFLTKSNDTENALERLYNVGKNLSSMTKEKQEAFIHWSEVMFCKDNNVYDYFEANKKEGNSMGFAEFVPGIIELLEKRGEKRGEERGKIKTVQNILKIKLKSEPGIIVNALIEDATFEKLEELEEKIFEIKSWKEVEKILTR